MCLGKTTTGVEGFRLAPERAKRYLAALSATVRRVAGKHCVDLVDFLAKLETWHTRECAKLKPEAEAKRQTLDDTHECLEALTEGLATVQELLSRISALFISADDKSPPPPCVKLSSVHRAKGLEWPIVYVLEQTLFLTWKGQSAAQATEEANLAYVAWLVANRCLCAWLAYHSH